MSCERGHHKRARHNEVEGNCLDCGDRIRVFKGNFSKSFIGLDQCREDVWTSVGNWSHCNPCHNKVVTPAGYCRLHDPELKKAREARRPPTRFERRCAADRAHEEKDRRREGLLREAESVLSAEVVCDGPRRDLAERIRAELG